MEHDLPLTLSRCSESVGDDIDLDRGIVISPQSHGDVLTDKQLINYKDHRMKFLSWLLNVGKTPERAKGYSLNLLKNYYQKRRETDNGLWY